MRGSKLNLLKTYSLRPLVSVISTHVYIDVFHKKQVINHKQKLSIQHRLKVKNNTVHSKTRILERLSLKGNCPSEGLTAKNYTYPIYILMLSIGSGKHFLPYF